MTINYKGNEYQLAETLRVAYRIQSLNGHKAYTKVFQEMADMPLEKQVEILYAAFDIANPGVATKQDFLDYYLDNYGMDTFMELLEQLMDAIMYHGVPEDQKAAKKAKLEAATPKAE